MKHNQILRRGLGILLSLVLCLSLLPATALAEGTATETADFTTDAEAALALLNAAKTEGAANSEWDPATSTLTLKGVDFTTSAPTAVWLPDGATIVLADGTENTIANVHGLIGSSVGIQANGNITIQGSGTLTVTAGTAAQVSCGIYADGAVTITGGTVTATGGETTQASWGSSGIDADGVTISGGTVTATGGKAATNSRGIYAYTNLTITGGTVTATGGETTQGWGSSGIDADGVTISGGTVTATGGEATGEESESFGICAYGDMDISGGTVTAKGGTAGKYSYGICSYYGGTTISGGTVNATGGTATGEKSDSYGILASTNIKISGGSVTATGSTATDESFGIFAYDTISISDTAEVTATGGNVDLYSCGIYADGAVTITGGTVTATGGEVTDEASESFGIESYDSETIIISGGHVIAQTLAGESATTRMALNAAPDLSSYTGYRWRTSADGNYTVGNFVWNTAPYDTYVEIAPDDDTDDDDTDDDTDEDDTDEDDTDRPIIPGIIPGIADIILGGGDDVITRPAGGKSDLMDTLLSLDTLETKGSSKSAFIDVAESDWFYGDVMSLTSKGIISGYPDGSFRPQGEVTWGEALKLVLLASRYGQQAPIGDHWASGYMDLAINQGFISGPVTLDAPITRGEMADLVKAAMKLGNTDIANPFDDEAPASALALYEADIIKGSADNGKLLFRSESTITRAEISAIIWRVYCAR